MTIVQLQRFQTFVQAEAMSEFHDGDCVGADDQAHRLVDHYRYLTKQKIKMHGHPCNIDAQRAWNEFDVEHQAKAPLQRNRDIVACSEVVYAAPKEFEEQMRGSGTWATMRYCVRQGVKLVVVWPDGTYEEDYVPDSMR
jgi:hypothetical protein